MRDSTTRQSGKLVRELCSAFYHVCWENDIYSNLGSIMDIAIYAPYVNLLCREASFRQTHKTC